MSLFAYSEKEVKKNKNEPKASAAYIFLSDVVVSFVVFDGLL